MIPMQSTGGVNTLSSVWTGIPIPTHLGGDLKYYSPPDDFFYPGFTDVAKQKVAGFTGYSSVTEWFVEHEDIQGVTLGVNGAEWTFPYYGAYRYKRPRFVYNQGTSWSVVQPSNSPYQRVNVLGQVSGAGVTEYMILQAYGADVGVTRFRRTPKIFINPTFYTGIQDA